MIMCYSWPRLSNFCIDLISELNKVRGRIEDLSFCHIFNVPPFRFQVLCELQISGHLYYSETLVTDFNIWNRLKSQMECLLFTSLSVWLISSPPIQHFSLPLSFLPSSLPYFCFFFFFLYLFSASSFISPTFLFLENILHFSVSKQYLSVLWDVHLLIALQQETLI